MAAFAIPAASLSLLCSTRFLEPFHSNCLRLGPRLLDCSNSPLSSTHPYGRRISSIVSQVGDPVLATNPPLSASDLQKKFGRKGLQFTDVGGMTVIELKLNNGSSARVLLQDARITSYKVLMWHGGLEEMLHAAVSSDATENRFSVTGGIFLSFSNEETRLSLLEENWLVDDVNVDPSNLVQLNLRCIGRGGGEKYENSWPCLQYVITLSNSGLVSAVIISNKGPLPVRFTGSVETQLSVSTPEAVSATGLRGCKFFIPASKLLKEATLSERAKQGGWSLLGKLRKHLWSNPVVTSDETDNIGKKESIAEHPDRISTEEGSINIAVDRSNWLTEEEPAPFRRGMYKIYSRPPDKIRVLDMGFRRSVVFERLGFLNFVLHGPEVDLEVNDEAAFVCVASASVLAPVLLSPGQIWKAAQALIPDF